MNESGYVLITGASGGLARALAARLAMAGWRMVMAGRDMGCLRDAYPGDAHVLLVGDACNPEGAAFLMAQCQERFGRPPDALAHCVGSVLVTALHRTSVEQYRACMSANLDSAFYSLSAWVSALRAARQAGAAVFVSTAAARIGTPNHEAVAAAKAGLEGLVRAAAATYAGAGIRVNAVAPGLMETPASAGLISSPLAREAAAKQYPFRVSETRLNWPIS